MSEKVVARYGKLSRPAENEIEVIHFVYTRALKHDKVYCRSFDFNRWRPAVKGMLG